MPLIFFDRLPQFFGLGGERCALNFDRGGRLGIGAFGLQPGRVALMCRAFLSSVPGATRGAPHRPRLPEKDVLTANGTPGECRHGQLIQLVLSSHTQSAMELNRVG